MDQNVPRRRVRDASDEEAGAEAELLRGEHEQADREDGPFLAECWVANSTG
jgi:hypothetical protein